MEINLDEFQAAFFEEVAEHLQSLEDGLLQLESHPGDEELIHGIFRAAHSIKGTGGALGFTKIAGFTHHIETLLDQMRIGKLSPSSKRIELLLLATDSLTGLIDAAKGEIDEPDNIVSLTELLQFELEAISDPATDFNMPQGEVEEFSLFDEELTAGPPEATSRSGREKRESRSVSSESIRVSVGKVEELINLVGELMISNSMVQQAFIDSKRESHELQEAITEMGLTTRQLQEKVMAVRMISIGTVFRRFPRIVRDLALALGKDIHLEISGQEIELDKQVIEEISDPLTHLIRNAVDHGVGSPAERTAAGKPAKARIQLRALHEAGNVVIEVIDDGAGINAERVRNKAIERGLISADAVLSDDETYALIMSPGFSTAEKVTDVSGRGVGMDVVKRNIEALSGSIQISSTPGQGSCFRIRLPLTMAILDGMAVRIGEETYILPLLSIVESLRPSSKQIIHMPNRRDVISVRGETVPLVFLHQLLGAKTGSIDPCEGLVIVVEHNGKKFGFVVNELIGQLQVVMKSLEANYGRVNGIAGATILGDGRVAMIIDLAGIVRLAS